jgi:hypothetical protein
MRSSKLSKMLRFLFSERCIFRRPSHSIGEETASLRIGSEIDPLSGNLSQTQTTSGRVLFFLLLWLSIVAFPRFPSNELDPSWSMVLSYALNQNLQFGKDIIFTYGPLGFLMGGTYAGIHFYSHIVWQFFCAAVFAWVIMRTARTLSPARSFFYYFYFLLLATIFDDAFHGVVVLLIGLDIIREAPHDKKLLPSAMSAFLGIISLIKFSDLLLSAIAMGCTSVYDVVHKRHWRALIVATVYGLSFIAIWTAVGQNPLNIPLYISNSLEITRGYNEGEAWEVTNRVFNLGLATALLLISYSVLYYIVHPNKIKSAFLVSLFGASLYLQWKHGFVQPNTFHVVGFFIFGLFPIMALPASLEDNERAQKTKNLLLLSAGMTSLLGVYFARPELIISSFYSWPDRMVGNVESIIRLPRLHAIYQERWQADQFRFDMPHVKREVGAASLDVLGYQQGIALYNHFRYTPRPIFQSYSVYTPRLIQANVDFFKSESGPEYVLQRYQTIANRFPSLDEARVLNIILVNYTFVFAENGYLLWKKQANSTSKVSFIPKLQHEQKLRFNERIELGELQYGNVWIAVKYDASFLGAIRALLYKPPSVRITVFDRNSTVGSFNLVGTMAKDGFLLNPLIENQFDLLRFISGQLKKQITAFSINIDASDEKFYRMPFELRLYSLPSLPPSEIQDSDFQSSTPTDLPHN